MKSQLRPSAGGAADHISEAEHESPPPMRERPGLTQASDAVITSGLSVHVFGNTVGIYSQRIEAGRGFAEMPVSDMLALMRFFALPESRKLLDLQSS
ncbi:MAG: hypothetical protein V4864_17035 [Pseudomonadota bacterium]